MNVKVLVALVDKFKQLIKINLSEKVLFALLEKSCEFDQSSTQNG